MAAPRVLVVGDVMLDRGYWGRSADRVAPEAPVVVVGDYECRPSPGGAANVAACAAALGASVTLAGQIGNDDAGLTLTALLGPDVKLRLESSLGRTTVKNRVWAGTHLVARFDADAQDPGHCGLIRPLLPEADRFDVIVLSDYQKSVFRSREARHDACNLIRAAHAAGAVVLADTKDVGFFHGMALCGVDAVAPNETELRSFYPDALTLGQAAEWAVRDGVKALVSTRGAGGLTYHDGKEFDHYHQPAYQPRQVFDVTGAGDTVVAALAAFWGLPVPDRLERAAVAAGLAVGRPGTTAVALAEVVGALMAAERTLPSWRDKILPSREAAAAWVRAKKAKGRSVAFSNGCFDLMHPGHLASLEFARRQAGCLIVGVNDDASVTRQKGPLRPVRPLAERQAVLAGLGCVDAVVAFGEDDPHALIRALEPDLLVKGGDYGPVAVVGADLVRSWGGRVELAPLEPCPSTSDTITDILCRYRGERR